MTMLLPPSSDSGSLTASQSIILFFSLHRQPIYQNGLFSFSFSRPHITFSPIVSLPSIYPSLSVSLWVLTKGDSPKPCGKTWSRATNNVLVWKRDASSIWKLLLMSLEPSGLQWAWLLKQERGTIVTFTFSYPLTAQVVGAPQITSRQVSSIFPCSPLPSGTWRTPGLSIPWCCFPASSSVWSAFFFLTLCLAKWFQSDLINGRHVNTIAVCVSFRWSGLPVVQLR